MTRTIEPMIAADAPRCAELETLLFPGDDPWSANAFVAELSTPHNRYVVVRGDDGVAVGYAGVSLLGSPGGAGESEVHTIGVDPAMHRQGIGGLLLDALLAFADEHGGAVFLEVRTDNVAAIELYRREGFDIVATRKGYYRPSGADAYSMVRRTGGAS